MIPAGLAEWEDDFICIPKRNSVHLLVQLIEIGFDLFVIVVAKAVARYRVLIEQMHSKDDNYNLSDL